MEIDKLYELREENFFNQVDSQKIDLLLQAATDWPTQVTTVEGFLTEVKKFLNEDNLTYENISSKMKSIKAAIYPWELEALSSLLELANLKNDSKLDNLLLYPKVIDEI